ncbi:MAG: division plane positioning ATPase MipZ [Hyphomonadaceae bacterium]
MQIVTISGYKGGTGKTTIAALLGVAAVQAGLRTATLDLDRNTRNLSNFLTLRRPTGLPTPDHVMFMDMGGSGSGGGQLENLANLARMDGYELLIIDTSSGHHDDLYEAHLLADVILTPMNESPADLHGLFTPPGARAAPRTNYRDMIDTARFDRRRSGRPEPQWHVCLNRISPTPTKIGSVVESLLSGIAAAARFGGIWRVRDRVAHKSISLEGRTVLDPLPPGQKLTMSEMSGRSEIRALLALVGEPQHMYAAA